MLKKRILASSLASVMALSSVSVVAFADETATSDIKTEVVSKAQLKEYVKSFETFVDEELEDYGTIQEGWFTDAIDAANVVIDDRNATDEDVTVAYQMLKAVENKLQMYTSAEVKELLDECKSDYETENVHNKTFGDKIWDEDTFDAFVDAYDRAEAYADEEGSADLNDAYLELESAHDALDANDFVTKTQFRNAYQQYIELKDEVYTYETWRRGKCSENATTGGYKDSKGNKLDISSASFVTFGELYNIVFGTSDDALWTADANGKKRGSAPAEGSSWIKIGKSRSGVQMTTVQSYIDEMYDYFLTNAEKNVTTDEEICTAYKSLLEAIKVFNGWDAVEVKGSKKVIFDDLLKKYRSDMLTDKWCGVADALITSMSTTYGIDWNTAGDKVLVTDAAKAAEILIDKNTGKFVLDVADNKTYKTNADTIDGYKVEKLGEKIKVENNTDITKYVPVTAEMVKDMATSTGAPNALDTNSTAADANKGKAQDILDVITATLFDASTAGVNGLSVASGSTKAQVNTAGEAVKTVVDTVTAKVTAASPNLDSYFVATGTGAYAKAKDEFDDACAALVATDPGAASQDDIDGAKKVLEKGKAYVAAIKTQATAAKNAAIATKAANDAAVIWYGQLENAIDMYLDLVEQDYNKANDIDYDYGAQVAAIDQNNTVGKKDSTKAYAILIKYATFALDNVYPVASSPKTLKDITNMANKAKDLIDATGEAAMFEKKNAALALARRNAIAFVADKRVDVDYEDGDDTTAMYNAVKNAYNALNDELAKYPVSYGDIAETLAEVAEGVDAGVYGASAASIKAAAEEIAFDMSTMDSFSTEGNSIFDEDRKFLFFNRVQSDGNDAEKALYTKYQALLAAVEEAVKEPEAPEVVKGDLTGDGVATPEDAIMIVKAFVGEITLTDAQKAAADFNGDGVVNADDALAVVKAYVGL